MVEDNFAESDSKYTLDLIHEVLRGYYFGSQSAETTIDEIGQKITAHNDRVKFTEKNKVLQEMRKEASENARN